MALAMVCIKLADLGHQARVHTVDQLASDITGQSFHRSERLDGIHHALVILVDALAHLDPIAVGVTLADMVNRCLRLIRIIGAKLSENSEENMVAGQP